MGLKQYQINQKINFLLNGDFDAAAVQELRQSFEGAAVSAQDDVIVDLSRVEFIDSSGIGVLVFLYKRLREKNLELILIGLTGQPKKMMNLLRIDKTIKTYPTLTSYIEKNAIVSNIRVSV